jgi:hypothetical protein
MHDVTINIYKSTAYQQQKRKKITFNSTTTGIKRREDWRTMQRFPATIQ